MSATPDDFSGPLNWEAFAAFELYPEQIVGALIELLESSEPIDGQIRVEMANALRRGRDGRARGEISLKIVGEKEAAKAGFIKKVELRKEWYEAGAYVHAKMLEYGTHKTGAIDRIQLEIEAELDQAKADNLKSKAPYLQVAYSYFEETNAWIDSLTKRPFYIREAENWRQDPQLQHWYHVFSAR